MSFNYDKLSYINFAMISSYSAEFTYRVGHELRTKSKLILYVQILFVFYKL